jgi:hypothetical protein
MSGSARCRLTDRKRRSGIRNLASFHTDGRERRRIHEREHLVLLARVAVFERMTVQKKSRESRALGFHA